MMSNRSLMSTALAVLALCLGHAHAQYQITVLHNNDGESQLFADGDGIGGVAEFKALFDTTKSFYQSQNHGVVSIYAGDTFLAGPEFQASLDSGVPGSRTFYDALAISRIGYDASIIGNHEFDFGPQVLAEFIGDAQSTNTTHYLSANLDFSGEADLDALATAGTIAPSKVVTVAVPGGTKQIGIIGATTTNLPFISSPGAVTASDVLTAVNTQVAALKDPLRVGGPVDHIILGSHLQGIDEDKALIDSGLSSDIDLIVAGGGDELLAELAVGTPSPTTVYGPSAPVSVVDTGLATGDTAEGAYPNQDKSIPIVTTKDQYSYLGRITLSFDSSGALTGIDTSSNPQLNSGFTPDAAIQSDVAPVQTYVDGLASNIIGQTSVFLLHGGSDTIRSQETNLGNLVADALLDAGQDAAPDFGVSLTPNRTVAMANGGGIRDDIPGNDISVLDTFNVSPFGNFVSVIEDVTVTDLVMVLENAYSRTVDLDPSNNVDPARQGSGTGRFAQIAGMNVVYDINAQALELDGDGNVVTPGQRIVSVILEDGTVLVEDGLIVPANAGTLVDVILPDFIAKGGDQYFDADYLSQAYGFTSLGLTDQQALQAYIESFSGADLITTYSNTDGEGRIVAVPEPASFGLITLAGLALIRRRRAA